MICICIYFKMFHHYRIIWYNYFESFWTNPWDIRNTLSQKLQYRCQLQCYNTGNMKKGHTSSYIMKYTKRKLIIHVSIYDLKTFWLSKNPHSFYTWKFIYTLSHFFYFQDIYRRSSDNILKDFEITDFFLFFLFRLFQFWWLNVF